MQPVPSDRPAGPHETASVDAALGQLETLTKVCEGLSLSLSTLFTVFGLVPSSQ
jgi:hypothetical protein